MVESWYNLNINNEELQNEQKYLAYTINIIRQNISLMGQELIKKEESIKEFKKFTWDNKSELDPQELKSLMTDNDLEVFFYEKRAKYFRNLYKIQNNPYFGSIIFKEGNELSDIYIGIIYLEDNDKQIIHDWRSPICSLFYDYELGPCSYIAPKEIIKGELLRKRQYKIENGVLKRIFDNSINIDDELLQEVLSNESSEKMKNIVNTIQQEQNKIIRNTSDRNLIVQGIAGSGKTSVALHRIAFLLYRIENLNSKNVLIFSPNQIFSEYISDVLPELGEENTMQTTFHDLFKTYITEYKSVETFANFIARYYTYEEPNPELVKYKQSDEIIDDFNQFAKCLTNKTMFKKDIALDNIYYSKEELNNLFHHRYQKLTLFERIDEMALRYSEINFNGSKKRYPTFRRLLMESLELKEDYKKIYREFYLSKYSKITLSDNQINKFINKKEIYYEDAILFVYLKSLLKGFPCNTLIKEIVIDEAQDYTKLEYLMITKIFKNSGLTILGDINQTINPYYKYNSLTDLMSIFKTSSIYLELTKTYRSSEEIIAYTNQILDLNYVRAIRKSNNKPVLFRKEDHNLKKSLLNDIKYLQKEYKSIAVITKDENEAVGIYNLLKNEINITLLNNNSSKFEKELIIVPSYIAKGLEFDSVIVYNKINNKYKPNELYLYYVACTRAQHELIVYN